MYNTQQSQICRGGVFEFFNFPMNTKLKWVNVGEGRSEERSTTFGRHFLSLTLTEIWGSFMDAALARHSPTENQLYSYGVLYQFMIDILYSCRQMY